MEHLIWALFAHAIVWGVIESIKIAKRRMATKLLPSHSDSVLRDRLEEIEARGDGTRDGAAKPLQWTDQCSDDSWYLLRTNVTDAPPIDRPKEREDTPLP
jgi:hypothetical protein